MGEHPGAFLHLHTHNKKMKRRNDVIRILWTAPLLTNKEKGALLPIFTEKYSYRERMKRLVRSPLLHNVLSDRRFLA